MLVICKKNRKTQKSFKTQKQTCKKTFKIQAKKEKLKFKKQNFKKKQKEQQSKNGLKLQLSKLCGRKNKQKSNLSKRKLIANTTKTINAYVARPHPHRRPRVSPSARPPHLVYPPVKTAPSDASQRQLSGACF